MACQIVSERVLGGVYEPTVTANGNLSQWNAQAVVVDKVTNLSPDDKQRIMFNYHNVPKAIPAPKLERADDVLGYLENPNYRVFLQADLKHAYYLVPFAKDCRHIYMPSPWMDWDNCSRTECHKVVQEHLSL